MSNTLEKQLREEILRRQQEKKQQERTKPRKKKTFVLLAILGITSIVVTLGRWQIEKSAPVQPNQPTPEGGKQNSYIYDSEVI